MPVTYSSTLPPGQLRRPYYPGHRSSYLELIPEEDDESISREELEAFARMAEIRDTSAQPSPDSEMDQMAAAKDETLHLRPTHSKTSNNSAQEQDYLSAGWGATSGGGTPSTPGLTRSNSGSDIAENFESFGNHDFPPVDRLTMFDILENLALPQRLEKMQNAVHVQAEKVRRQRAKIASRARSGQNKIVDEWRKRVTVAPEEKLDKYRNRMRRAVDRMGKRWNNSKSVTLQEKISFVTAVLNIFISAYMIGAYPEYFHIWYTGQLFYFMPIRWYRYYKIGYHYFLADLCYFTNLLCILTIWFFPQSKRLLISTYCLAFGNNAVAIALWRNSLVFHSLDKTTTLFIHIMPCATLHVMVHVLPEAFQLARFPAIHTIKYSLPGAPEHYKLWDMVFWATLPYAVWQLSFYFLITVRKRSKIEAGAPTSFTWLRKSYKGNILGKFVLSFPEALQETVFMFIQYGYALLTMLPCPLWFWYKWASAAFMMFVFTWASWNGATYYIDAYGRRMEKELEALKKEVSQMSKSPELYGMDGTSPFASPAGPQGLDGVVDGDAAGKTSALDLGPAAQTEEGGRMHRRMQSGESVPTQTTAEDEREAAAELRGMRDMANPADVVGGSDAPDLTGEPSTLEGDGKKMK